MFTGFKSHLPPQILLFLLCFPQFLFSQPTSRFFFSVLLLGIDDSFWSSEWLLFWPSLISPVSQTEEISLPPCTSSWIPCFVYVHSPGRTTRHTSLCWSSWVHCLSPVLQQFLKWWPCRSRPSWLGTLLALMETYPAGSSWHAQAFQQWAFQCNMWRPLFPVPSFWLGGSLQPQALPGQLSELTAELGQHRCSCGSWHCHSWGNSPESPQTCLDFSFRCDYIGTKPAS